MFRTFSSFLKKEGVNCLLEEEFRKTPFQIINFVDQFSLQSKGLEEVQKAITELIKFKKESEVEGRHARKENEGYETKLWEVLMGNRVERRNFLIDRHNGDPRIPEVIDVKYEFNLNKEKEQFFIRLCDKEVPISFHFIDFRSSFPILSQKSWYVFVSAFSAICLKNVCIVSQVNASMIRNIDARLMKYTLDIDQMDYSIAKKLAQLASINVVLVFRPSTKMAFDDIEERLNFEEKQAIKTSEMSLKVREVPLFVVAQKSHKTW